MSLLNIIIVLVVVGLALYLINRYLPLDGKIKTILNWVVVIFVIIWLLKATGILGQMGNVRI